MKVLVPSWRSGLLFLVSLLAGCGGAGTGCSGMTPIPGGRYAGTKTDNAVNVRLSSSGVSYLNNNWRTLLEQFAPGQKLEFPFGCTLTNVPAVGDVIVADQGSSCSTPGAETCGVMDGKCCPTPGTSGCAAGLVDRPQTITLQVTGFQLSTRPPDSIEAVLSVSVNTGQILVSTVNRNIGYCAFASPAKCAIDFNSASSTPPANTLNATVKFTIDQRWDKLLAFSVTSVNGTSVCGASGASSKPACLDPADINLAGQNTCGNVYCGLADWDPIKGFILRQISPMLEAQVKTALAGQSCQACGPNAPCPSVGGLTSTCDARTSQCMDSATGKCVPRFLGVEGRISTASFLGSFGAPANAALDLTLHAGSAVTVDQGLSLGTRGGLNAAKVSECVPSLPAPPLTAVPVPNFDTEATLGSGYHVGVGISRPFLNLAMHHAHQSGTLCLNVSSAAVGLMNTGLFKTFLPSLGKLVTRDGKDAPMMMVLRPGRPPTLTVGKGTFDPATKKPLKPLLTLAMDDLSFDFYAMVDDRFVRLFSLTADVQLPLSLIFDGCSSVQPALGDLKQLVTNVRTANSELLAEDPKVLADLVPAVIGLAEPAIASALKPFALPQLGNFKLKVNETKGVGLIAGTENYHHLGIYAQLVPASAACAVSAPVTSARLDKSVIPPAEALRLQGRPLPWPTAVLHVEALGVDAPAEFSYRVDGGLWSTFLVPSAGGTLEVSHPSFLLQGKHLIEVRARLESEPHGISAPTSVEFTVDWEAPQVRLDADRAENRLIVHSRDNVTGEAGLSFAYRVGEGALGAFGSAREIDLASVEAAGGLEVHVRDEAGNVGFARYRVPTTANRPSGMGTGANLEPTDPTTAAGCAAVPGALPLLGLAALLGLARRRSRTG